LWDETASTFFPKHLSFPRGKSWYIRERHCYFLKDSVFPHEKLAMDKKITEQEMLERFATGATLLPPLIIRTNEVLKRADKREFDALIEAGLPGEQSAFRFVVEAKSRPTLEAVHAAAAQARAAVRENEWPMIQVPYLAPDRLDYLTELGVSGVDLCGNGLVIIPERLYVLRSGQPNKYRDSRPLNNPYRGRSSLVARILMSEPSWPSLSKMLHRINHAGTDLSLAQASKAIRALEEELIVRKVGGAIQLQDPARLLDKLGSEWSPIIRARRAFRLDKNDASWADRFSSNSALRWAVTGESSAQQYVVFSHGTPLRIAVSNLSKAESLLIGVPESVPGFADLELLETDEPGYFFDALTDGKGVRWASRLQTWLELQSGEARQQTAARDLKRQVLRGFTNDT
jgi:hypothetical protein